MKNGGLAHIEPWISPFNEAKYEYIVIVRSFNVYTKLIKKYPDLAVSLISSPESLDKLLEKFPSIIGFFYVANTANNNTLLRISQGTHIFLGHGDSDKTSSMNRFFRAYDEIYVAGQAHIDRFKKAKFKTNSMIFKIIGRPDSQTLLSTKRSEECKYHQAIYLPTWEGYCTEQDYSSLDIFQKIIETLIENTELPIINKLHPLTGVVKKEYYNIEKSIPQQLKSRVRFINRNEKLTAILKQDSIFICDTSAAVSEALLLDCPIFIYIPKNKNMKTATGEISPYDFLYTFSSTEELIIKLKKVLSGNDYLAEKRKGTIEYFISTQATINQEFKRLLNDLAKT